MGLKILLIADTPSCTEQLGLVLSAQGHLPLKATIPADLARLARKHDADAVVIALSAEKIPALAIDKAPTAADGATIPVIVVSDSPALEAELLEIFDFIPSPLDRGRLLDDLALIEQRKGKRIVGVKLDAPLYGALSDFILDRSGLQFGLRNRSHLERALNRRMAALRFTCAAEYLAYLREEGKNRRELDKLLSQLTVGETCFFRYPSHFRALRDFLKEKAIRPEEPIRIWSAGCSTGEEPYSVAMTVMEALPDWGRRDIRILATDINGHSLARARAGVYSRWSVRVTAPHKVERYFAATGNTLVVRDEVKRLVDFFPFNLATPGDAAQWSRLQDLDAIFCRNVLIYFAPEPADRAIRELAKRLKPGGKLFLGHAESLFQRAPELELRRSDESFYYAKAAPAEAPLPPPLASLPEPKGFAAPQHRFAPPQLPPSPAPEALIAAARHLLDAKRVDDALKVVEQLLLASPPEPTALVLKGFALVARGRLEEALEASREAMTLDDLLPEAYFLKGVALDLLERLPEAAEEYRKALLLDHNFIMPRFRMGRLHQKLGRVPEAEREFRNGIMILKRHRDLATVPYSGGLSRTVCLQEMESALSQVA